MPVATRAPTAPPVMKPALPAIEPKSYESIVADDNQRPLNSLITYMEGTPWTVDYFNQIVTKDNDVRELDPGQVNIYQQYTKIGGLEIRVTSALTNSQETESGLVTVTGSALIYPFMVPNAGDMFVAEAAEGRKGVYRIDAVERKTFNRESAYSIEYQLVCYTDTDIEMYQNLEAKAIRTYYFDKERLLEGLQPNLIPEDYKRMNDLRVFYDEICRFYFKTFVSREFSTLIVPGQDVAIYDSFLVNYLLKIVDTFDAPEIRSVKNLSNENETYLSQNQFWTALFERDLGILKTCNREMGLTMIKNFGYDPAFHGLRYTKLDYIVYPIIADPSVLSGSSKPILKAEAMAEIVRAPNQPGSLSALIHDNYIAQNQSIPFIHSMLTDNNYVLSSAFYEEQIGQSILEALTLDYIKGNALNIDRLTQLTQHHVHWGRLEQFYYIPILLTLIKSAIKGLY